MRRECPNTKDKNKQQNNNSQNSPAKANRLRWVRANPETFIEIDIADGKHCCLLDTGCDHSMIPQKLVREATLIPVDDVEVKAANGTSIEILGSMRVAFEIQGHPFSANLLVSEDISEFMLGFDWLKLNEAEWNFARKTLTVRGLEIPLKTRKSRASVRRVYVRERIVIPPNTEQNVPVKLVNSSFRTPTSEWLVDPCTLVEKVFVARVLLSNQDKHAAL